MSCEHLDIGICDDCLALDALFADLPPPQVPADLIAQTRADMALEVAAGQLSTPAVPADLVAQTRAAMAAEIAAGSAEARPPDNVVPLWQRISRSRPVLVGLSMAAAALLFVSLTGPQISPADPDSLVEKGAGGTLPDVSLNVAVRSGDSTARLSQERRYAPGDVLYFRTTADRPADVLLVRLDVQGAEVIHHSQQSSGATDLPLSWTLESGETDAAFALVAGVEPIAADAVEAALADTWPTAPCETLRPMGVSCESVRVGVEP